MIKRRSVGRFISGVGITLLIVVIGMAVSSGGLSLLFSGVFGLIAILFIAIGQYLTYHAEMVDALDRLVIQETDSVEVMLHVNETMEDVGSALVEINNTLKEIRDRLDSNVTSDFLEKKLSDNPPNDPPNNDDDNDVLRAKQYLREKAEKRAKLKTG